MNTDSDGMLERKSPAARNQYSHRSGLRYGWGKLRAPGESVHEKNWRRYCVRGSVWGCSKIRSPAVVSSERLFTVIWKSRCSWLEFSANGRLGWSPVGGTLVSCCGRQTQSANPPPTG